MKKLFLKKIVPVFMCVCLLVGMLPVSAFAAEKPTDLTSITSEQILEALPLNNEAPEPDLAKIMKKILEGLANAAWQYYKLPSMNDFSIFANFLEGLFGGDDDKEKSIMDKLNKLLENQGVIIDKLDNLQKQIQQDGLRNIVNKYSDTFNDEDVQALKRLNSSYHAETLKNASADKRTHERKEYFSNYLVDKVNFNPDVGTSSAPVDTNKYPFRANSVIDKAYSKIAKLYKTTYLVQVGKDEYKVTLMDAYRMLRRLSVPWEHEAANDVNAFLVETMSFFTTAWALEYQFVNLRIEFCKAHGLSDSNLSDLMEMLEDLHKDADIVYKNYQANLCSTDSLHYWHPDCDIKFVKYNNLNSYKASSYPAEPAVWNGKAIEGKWIWHTGGVPSYFEYSPNMHGWDYHTSPRYQEPYFNNRVIVFGHQNDDGSRVDGVTAAKTALREDNALKMIQTATTTYKNKNYISLSDVLKSGNGILSFGENDCYLINPYEKFGWSAVQYAGFWAPHRMMYYMGGMYQKFSGTKKDTKPVASYDYIYAPTLYYTIDGYSGGNIYSQYYNKNSWLDNVGTMYVLPTISQPGVNSNGCDRFYYSGYVSGPDVFRFICEGCAQTVTVPLADVLAVYKEKTGEDLTAENGKSLAATLDAKFTDGDVPQDVLNAAGEKGEMKQAGEFDKQNTADQVKPLPKIVVSSSEKKLEPSEDEPIEDLENLDEEDLKYIEEEYLSLFAESLILGIAFIVIAGILIAVVNLRLRKKKAKAESEDADAVDQA